MAPVPFSAAVMHQAYMETTTVLAPNVLQTTPSAPSLAGERTPCGFAHWEAASPSIGPIIAR